MKAPTAAPSEAAAVVERLLAATRWRALALLLAPPGPGVAAALAGLARTLPGAEGPGLAALAAAAEDDAGSLWACHHRLLGPGGHVPSCETDLWPSPLGAKGGTLGDIAGFYRAFGFDPTAEWRESPDHVATECAFAGWLELKRAYARARGDRDEEEIAADALRRFHDAHLGRCLAALLPRLGEADPEGFYAQVAEWADSTSAERTNSVP